MTNENNEKLIRCTKNTFPKCACGAYHSADKRETLTYTVQFWDGEIRRANRAQMIAYFQGIKNAPEGIPSKDSVDDPGEHIGWVENWDFEKAEIDINLHGEYDPDEMIASLLIDGVEPLYVWQDGIHLYLGSCDDLAKREGVDLGYYSEHDYLSDLVIHKFDK